MVKTLLDEAAVEHDTLKYLIEQIHDAEDDDLLTARVTVLGEYVKHHVKEEETELFPKLKQTDMDMAAVGEQLEGRKIELAAEKGSPGDDEDDEEDQEEDEEA
jgi:hemerythrin superfamily protein